MMPHGFFVYGLSCSAFIVFVSMTTCVCVARQEVAGLEAKVSGAKEQYHLTLASAKAADTLSALPQFALNDKFVLNQDECWYTLSLELQVPIECVILQVGRFWPLVWGWSGCC